MSYLGKFSMQVAVVSTFPWGDEDEKAEMEDLVHRAEAAEGRHISAKVFVRKGCSVQSTVVRTFPLLLLLPPNWLEG
jgi:hypothetical protein